MGKWEALRQFVESERAGGFSGDGGAADVAWDMFAERVVGMMDALDGICPRCKGPLEKTEEIICFRCRRLQAISADAMQSGNYTGEVQ